MTTPQEETSLDEATQSEDELPVESREPLGKESQQRPPPSDDDEATDLDDDGLLIQEAEERVETSGNRQPAEEEEEQLPQPKRRQVELPELPKAKAPRLSADGGAPIPRPAARRPGVTLKRLVDEGFLVPGKGVFRCEYKGMVSVGELTGDGRISWEGLMFDSPSAWSIHLKRLVTPNRKADDGWKTIKYEGKFLEHFKLELAQRVLGSSSSAAKQEDKGGALKDSSKAPQRDTGGALKGGIAAPQEAKVIPSNDSIAAPQEAKVIPSNDSITAPQEAKFAPSNDGIAAPQGDRVEALSGSNAALQEDKGIALSGSITAPQEAKAGAMSGSDMAPQEDRVEALKDRITAPQEATVVPSNDSITAPAKDKVEPLSGSITAPQQAKVGATNGIDTALHEEAKVAVSDDRSGAAQQGAPLQHGGGTLNNGNGSVQLDKSGVFSVSDSAEQQGASVEAPGISSSSAQEDKAMLLDNSSGGGAEQCKADGVLMSDDSTVPQERNDIGVTNDSRVAQHGTNGSAFFNGSTSVVQQGNSSRAE